MMPPVVALCLCLSWGGQPPDRWAAEDKWKHLFASFVVTSVSGSAARAAGLDTGSSAWVGAGVGTAVGVWKEARDAARPDARASLVDLAWDMAGVGAGAVVLSQAR